MTAYAVNLYGSAVNTSQLTAGTDYDIVQDMVLTIDKSVRIGRLYTGKHGLTIKGSEGTKLTVSDLRTSSGGTANDIVLKSGSVEVDSINGSNSSREAVYTSGLLRIEGGTLAVYCSRSEPTNPFTFGVNVSSFEMSGGSLTVDVRTGNNSSTYGLYIFGKKQTLISGGTIDITSLGTGIGLGQDCSLTISGGYVSAEGGLATAAGYGLYGAAGTSLRISGGQVFAKGGEHGILFPAAEISGTARVDTEGQQACGISTASFSIRDSACLRARGRTYAILTEHSRGGISIGAQHYFVKPASAAISTPADRGETDNREFIAESVRAIGVPATEVVIDIPSSDSPGSTDDGSGQSSGSEQSSGSGTNTGDGEVGKSDIAKIPINAELKAPDAAKFFVDGNTSKKKMTVHFEKVEKATGYIITWKQATGKKWKYAKCGDQDSYVIRGLKKGTLLDVKIASYAYGRRGPWSKTGRFFFESAKASVVRKGRKLTVVFGSVNKATGYQLLLAGNRKMTGYKLRSVKNKRKLVVNNLNKSRKYYIRWRPYRTYKGKKYLGLLSKVKKI
ncbi:MAG: hypothetical protein J6S83_02835 [Lachnospiraceae bacterium]|nr:hypothetical protein [Lachnospiraceae bacterium]